MKYLRLAIAFFLVLCSQLTFADSIKTYVITQVSMSMAPNVGAGDNISFSFTGPGVSISGIAGMLCIGWCDDQPIFGTPVVAPTQIFLSSLDNVVILGGVSYYGGSVFFDGDGPFDDSGGITRLVSGGAGDNNLPFQLILPQNGKWKATFEYIPPSDDIPGYYAFREATFSATIPEPGTIVLMTTGLAGVAGMVRRRNFRR
jgi:hypothetical protein